MKKFLYLIVALLAIPSMVFAAASSTATPSNTSRSNAAIMIDGAAVTNGVALIYDGDGNILRGQGTTVPATSASGYSKGAIWVDTDVTTGTGSSYENIGNTTAAVWSRVGASGVASSLSTQTITLAAGVTNGGVWNNTALAGGTIIGFYPVLTDHLVMNGLSLSAAGGLTFSALTNGAASGITSSWKVIILVP